MKVIANAKNQFIAALTIVFVTEALSSTILIMYESCYDSLKIVKAQFHPPLDYSLIELLSSHPDGRDTVVSRPRRRGYTAV